MSVVLAKKLAAKSDEKLVNQKFATLQSLSCMPFRANINKSLGLNETSANNSFDLTNFFQITCVSGSTSASGSSEIGGGSKKLKKLSFLTCLVIVRTLPLLLCFCFFLTVFTVRFLPGSFQLIVQPLHLKISGPENKINI